MANTTTMFLVQKARDGDSDARHQLVVRFYQDWIDKFHGDLGKTIRKLYDTQDLVQSALADALPKLSTLRNERVFFTWVTSIIRHKIAAEKRRLRRERPLENPRGGSGFDPPAAPSEGQTRERVEVYLETLDAILALFPEHPEEMAVVVMKLVDDRPVASIVEFLGIAERTVFLRLQKGLALLKKKLSP